MILLVGDEAALAQGVGVLVPGFAQHGLVVLGYVRENRFPEIPEGILLGHAQTLAPNLALCDQNMLNPFFLQFCDSLYDLNKLQRSNDEFLKKDDHLPSVACIIGKRI